MATNAGQLYSPDDLNAMRNQIAEIDAQLVNIKKLEEVNAKSPKQVYDLQGQEQTLKELRGQLQAILDVFG